MVKSWFRMLKREDWRKELAESKKKHPFVKDYRFGRCQVADGTGCIRNLQSPERRKFAGSSPQGKVCMYCEDDSYKYSDVPEEIWQRDDWKNADTATKQKILDEYVKKNPKYSMRDFEPFY